MKPSFPIRVYYEDTDSGGVVYYANYLKFAERARTELLRSEGFENKSLRDNKGILLVVRHIEADYFKPAFLDDTLEVITTVTTVKNASVTLKQSITSNQTLIFELNVALACIDEKTLTPARLPDDLKAAFEKHL